MIIDYEKSRTIQVKDLKAGQEFEHEGEQYIRLDAEGSSENGSMTGKALIPVMRKAGFLVMFFRPTTEVRAINSTPRKTCKLEDIRFGGTFQLSEKERSTTYILAAVIYTNNQHKEVGGDFFMVDLETGRAKVLKAADMSERVYPVTASVTVG